jgi:hypothetical protein
MITQEQTPELLPKTKKKNGYTYKQLKRGKKAFIYAQHDPRNDRIVAFEVFELKIQKEKVANYPGAPEVFYPSKERFPGNEDFGRWAWTYSRRESAESKFEELEKKEEKG